MKPRGDQNVPANRTKANYANAEITVGRTVFGFQQPHLARTVRHRSWGGSRRIPHSMRCISQLSPVWWAQEIQIRHD